MSLDELLKEPNDSSVWKRQRKKLVRVTMGIVISAIALVGGIVLLLSFKKPHAIKTDASAVQQDKDADALAQLMRVQKEAEGLKKEIHRRQPASMLNSGGPRGFTREGGPSERIISYEPGDGFATLTKLKNDLYIPTGAVFQAQLLTPIKTSVEKTFVMAETTNEYRMDMKRKILRGSRLIGRSHFDPILKGVVVEFTTVVSPSGIESSVSGLALSRNALPEIEGLYFSDKLVNYGTALAFGFLAGFADAGRSQAVTVVGPVPEVTMANQVLAGLSASSFQVANQILSDIRTNSIEYVIVPAGERVFVVLTRRYDIAQEGSKNETH